jgi:hypothetical protein
VNRILHALGTVHKLLSDMLRPMKLMDVTTTVKQLTAKLAEHFQVKLIATAERNKFHRRDQQENESVADFVAALRSMASTCNFTDVDQSMGDRLVAGCRSLAMSKRLMEADKKFAEMVEIAKSMEASEAEIQQRTNRTHQPQETINAFVHKAKKQHMAQEAKQNSYNSYNKGSFSQPKKVMCYRCGKNHLRKDCKVNPEVRCNHCSKIGHLSVACMKKSQRNVNQVEHEEFNSLFMVKTSQPGYFVPVQLQSRTVDMMVDTGASLSIVNEEIWKELGKPKLKPVEVPLITYSKNKVDTLGKCNIAVTYEKKQFMLPVIIAEESAKIYWAGTGLKSSI